MEKKSTANLKLVDNLIVSPDTPNGEVCWFTWLQNQGSLRIEAAIDCLRAISEGMISVECSHEF